jgi:hypothetical protein
MSSVGGAYDPETVSLLRTVLDQAWDTLLPHQQARLSKSEMAARMLRFAAQGERDPVRLRARAVIDVIHDGPGAIQSNACE